MKHIYTYMITAALAALALAGCRNEESIAFNLDTDKIASAADGGRYNLKVSAQNGWVAGQRERLCHMPGPGGLRCGHYIPYRRDPYPGPGDFR